MGTEIKTASPTSGRDFEENLHSLVFLHGNPNGYEHRRYGRFCGRVAVKTKGYKLADLRVKSWSFEVPDSKTGVMAVAKALGHGMADLSPALGNQEAHDELQKNYGIKLKKVKRHSEFTSYGQGMTCEEPVLAISPDTLGYRCVWGGVLEAYDPTAELSSDGLSMHFYKLHPGMKDGGCLVQSASSSATILARKSGGIWTVTLIMPMLGNGRTVGKSYDSAFRGAYKWYCDSTEQQLIA